jgi:hypothetical protein
VPLFEALVAETHQAAMHTAVIASGVNALRRDRMLKTPLALQSFIPQRPSTMEAAPRCWRQLGLVSGTLRTLEDYFATFGHAGGCIEAFCSDVEQWGAEQAAFLHAKQLITTWRQVCQRGLKAIEALHPDMQRCLPARYGQNTSVLRKLLLDVFRGETACLDANGIPFVPELPQRRPAARRNVNLPCIVEHQGQILRAIVKDISSSGLGLEKVPRMAEQKVALVEFENGRCLAGTIVWAKGTTAGIKFDTPLSLSDPLLVN